MDLKGPTSVFGETASPGIPSPRLQNAAHQFEASMLQELLKPLQERSEFSDKDQDDDDSGSGASVRQFGTEAMARALSEHGGMGIAKMVLAKLAPIEEAQGQHPPAGPEKS
jgi:Rod binding domain-containing protein